MLRIDRDTYVGAPGGGFDLSAGAMVGVSLLGDGAPPLLVTVQPRGEPDASKEGLQPIASCTPVDGSVSPNDPTRYEDADGKSYAIVRPAAKSVHIVVNPACGFKRAREWVDELVLPLLEMVGVTAEVHETAAEGDGEPIARRIVESATSPPTIIACGGDGTTSEVINGIGESAATLIILPLGTANAFYAAMYAGAEPVSEQMQSLRSLVAFVRGQGEAAPLPLARVAWSPTESALVHVVGSFALHASILHDAAHDPVPGLERFKRAAAANIARQYEGTLWLRQARAYDRTKGEFGAEAQDVNLNGPFSYIASALVDRFEVRELRYLACSSSHCERELRGLALIAADSRPGHLRRLHGAQTSDRRRLHRHNRHPAPVA